MIFSKVSKQLCCSLLLCSISTVLQAATTYSEAEFLKLTLNKDRAYLQKVLGTPAKISQSIRPKDVEQLIGRPVSNEDNKQNVEMWYYKNLVRYDAHKTYKTTELTLANGRCVNVGFFNQ